MDAEAPSFSAHQVRVRVLPMEKMIARRWICLGRGRHKEVLCSVADIRPSSLFKKHPPVWMTEVHGLLENTGKGSARLWLGHFWRIRRCHRGTAPPSRGGRAQGAEAPPGSSR